MRWSILAAALLAALVLVPCPALSCSYCSSVQQAPTFRQEAGQPYAKLILYGTLSNPDNGKTTELQIKSVLRSDPALGDKKAIPLTKYLPADPKNPPKFLIFSDVDQDKFDTYRGVPLKTDEGLEYVKKTLKLDPKDRTGNLLFYFNYLEHPDDVVANDAFLEFAKAGDKEIGQLAGKLSAEKLRGWLKNPKTPPERLGLYAFLLGGCGGDDDAAYLLSILKDPSERMLNAYDGILGGYIHLKPKEGWQLAVAILKDGRQPFQQRLSVVRALQFYHGWQPVESRPHILKGLAAMLEQGELADVAIEDLRRWEMWDLTRDVLGVYGKKGYNGPIMRKTIVRYALSCKDDKDAARFIEARRKDDPELVKDEEESLKYDK
jgi:hypothetical protein